ncbi:MAG: peptidoglycan DD-metalloendopeptidase family protein [Bacteroidia bacterium]|nr:peptidoglycan DD-metalloendopeptidase family protein [Bacteroidia bacterium]
MLLLRKIISWLAVFVLSANVLHAEVPDTSRLNPQQRRIASSIEQMSEPELILLLDSLFDTDGKDTILFVMINRQLDTLRNSYPKNQFNDGFAFFPGQRFYGSWNTKMLFPYPDSLYKADTLIELDLSPAVSGPFVYPFNGTFTSGYGWRDSAFHRGIDIDLNRGDTVRAAFTGMVRFAGKQGGYGNVVIVRHYNGLETVYAHLWKIKVKPGDIVTSGQLLGLGGNTGHSTGTHLHFEMRFRGVAINPAYIISIQERKLHCEKIALVRTKQGYAVRPHNVVYHIVQRGDNVTKIAQQYGRTVKDIRTFNGWDGNPRLKQGQQVRVVPPTENGTR